MWRFYDSSGRVKQNTKPTISLVTSLPSNPADGDEIIFTDSLTAGTYQWHLRYVAARSSNKWVYIGGPSIFSEVVTSETTSSTAYAALATAGPSIAVPVAGDYFVGVGYTGPLNAAVAFTSYMSYDIGGTGAVDADAVTTTIGGGSGADAQAVYRRRKKTGLTAVTLTAKYKASSGSAVPAFASRWMELIPIAIGG